jgi:hypothetical protein
MVVVAREFGQARHWEELSDLVLVVLETQELE